MSEINLKLKSYDELIFEITTLNTDKYLLEQKVNKQKEVLDKIKKYIKEHQRKDEFLTLNEWQTRELLELLEEIE